MWSTSTGSGLVPGLGEPQRIGRFRFFLKAVASKASPDTRTHIDHALPTL
ncbi:MAG: hypothetical protein JWP83_3320 [Mycobacterium sp.]|jgi:hypothetical protein|nr:hypothetical protein [Mycobacterium sp.]MCW2662168.1 hypothetical protein [Mycobacterium sp.]